MWIRHNKEEKAFSISKLLASARRQIRVKNTSYLVVLRVHLCRADRQYCTELMTWNWCRRSTHSNVINLKPFLPCCDHATWAQKH